MYWQQRDIPLHTKKNPVNKQKCANTSSATERCSKYEQCGLESSWTKVSMGMLCTDYPPSSKVSQHTVQKDLQSHVLLLLHGQTKTRFRGEGFPWSPKNDLKLNKNTGLVCRLLRHSVLIYREGCWLSPSNVKHTRYLCQIHFVLHILTSPNHTGLLHISVSAAQYAPI